MVIGQIYKGVHLEGHMDLQLHIILLSGRQFPIIWMDSEI